MSPEVERLLEGIAQIPAAERSAFLKRECLDAEVRAEVESLLPFYTNSESCFEVSLREIARSVRRAPELSAGDQAGAYRILSLIGIGGMGAVYLASRVDGTFEQEVAIKVVPSANAAFLLERFEPERRILALLDHPNIARILDAGEAPNGLPYLAMEYVRGEPLDEFCEGRGLPLADRLKLFLKVCEAVGHAHSRLIVHRDLKPANVLVTAGGEPKLLDFGIAKVLDPQHAETSSTRVLTPDYASPEQVRGEPVTTASDIYSLGALLYKTISGFPPHRLENKSPLQAARIISEVPAVPVTTVSPEIPADVCAILCKALHNDPVRRYAFVTDFSADILRFLEQRPVLAAADSFAYRARRFLARNSLVSAISALAIFAVLFAAGVAAYQGRRAQRRFDQVRQFAHVALFDFDQLVRDVPGTLPARVLIASSAQRYLRQLEGESSGDIELEREIAESYQRLGDIQGELAGGTEQDTGIASLRKSYDIHKRLGDDQSRDDKQRGGFIKLVSNLAKHYKETRNAKEAATWTEEGTRLAQAWVNVEPQNHEALDAAQVAFSTEGLRLETAGQSERAREYMEKGVVFGERAHAVGPTDNNGDSELAKSQLRLSNLLVMLKRYSEALPYAQQSLALMEHLEQIDSTNRRWRRVYGLALSSNGITYEQLAEKDPPQLPVAVEFLKRADLVASGMARDDPQSTLAKDDLITQDNRYAYVLRLAKHANEAAVLYQKASETARELALAVPNNRRNWYLWAVNRVDYGELRLEQRHAAEAESILESADAPIAKALAFDPRDATILEMRTSELLDLAEVGEILGHHSRARQKMRECLDVASEMIQRDASAKNYITQYRKILALAKRLNVHTDLR